MAVKLQPTNGGAYNQIGEGLTMYGYHGGVEQLGGMGALEVAPVTYSSAVTCLRALGVGTPVWPVRVVKPVHDGMVYNRATRDPARPADV